MSMDEVVKSVKSKRNNKKKLELELQLPKTIMIFGKEFKVIVTSLKGLHGDCNIGNLTIRIHQNLTKEEALSTLFHEAIHASLGISGLNEMLTENQEEAIVRMLEHAFADIVDITKLSKEQN